MLSDKIGWKEQGAIANKDRQRIPRPLPSFSALSICVGRLQLLENSLSLEDLKISWHGRAL